MNDFHDIAAFVASQRDRMGELVRDQFGASIIADVIEPLLSETHGLASLSEETESAIQAAGCVIAEARSLGGLETT
jgi:hypothetical protein